MPLSGNAGLVGTFEAQRRQVAIRGRIIAAAMLLALGILLAVSAQQSEFLEGDYGDAPLARVASFLQRMNPHLSAAKLFAGSPAPGSLAYWFYAFPKWLRALWTSIEMAVLATVIGGVFAFAMSLVMARTVTRHVVIRQIARLLPNMVRTMPAFILAMLLVPAVGPGAVAGTLALTLICFTGLARPFADILENADTGPMESVRAAGGGRMAQIRYGLVPLVAPNMLSYVFAWVEINVSISTALGIVGTGGIGQELANALAYNQYDSYLAMMLMIAVVIIATDLSSEAVRHRFFGLELAR
ncbi:PhnE/PtxC family ABC transporter permease [Sphingomonas sp. GlSt437]|uniref:PhnE/PtxC family ABC transporter permease n=1 Tax=Sphingomonas sp. GlSt437 TaxID=3389970 RepID=UPI003A88794B